MKQELYPKILVFLQFLTITIIVLLSHGFFNSIIRITIFIIGLYIGILALKDNYLGNFHIQPKMKENAKLITTGIYTFVRHPMYLSVTIMSLAFILESSSIMAWVSFFILIMVLHLKAKREESIWIKENKDYNIYRNRTKSFLPFIL